MDYQRVECSDLCGSHLLIPKGSKLSSTKGLVSHIYGSKGMVHERIAYEHELAAIQWNGKSWVIVPTDFDITDKDRVFLT